LLLPQGVRREKDPRSLLSAKLRNETDLGALSSELMRMVRETMQPAHVSMWLHPDTASKKDDVPG